MKFWTDKIKIVNSTFSIVHKNSNKNENEYIEIRTLIQQQSKLDQLSKMINDFSHIISTNLELMSYQISIKEAYVAEFERDFEKVFGRAISYSNYR